jgi:four helix bundle protein
MSDECMKDSILANKSFDFAIRIVNLYKYLTDKQREYVLSKQLLRSGTAIGALQSEACFAESKADFIHKFGIAQKECNETIYWLNLLHRSQYLDLQQYESLNKDAVELMKMITSTILTTKKSLTTNR